MKKISNGPGPGQYTPRSGQKDCEYSVPKAQRNSLYKDIEKVPGPGSYEISLDIGGPKYQIAKAERYFNKKYVLPGPGAYNIKSEVDTPSYSMNTRRSISSHEANPGPGAYSPKLMITEVKYSIGRSEHFTNRNKVTPGPGTYSPSPDKIPVTSIGIGQRPPLSLILDTPGPGTYNTFKTFQTPSYSISKKNHLKKLDPEPVISN